MLTVIIFFILSPFKIASINNIVYFYQVFGDLFFAVPFKSLIIQPSSPTIFFSSLVFNLFNNSNIWCRDFLIFWISWIPLHPFVQFIRLLCPVFYRSAQSTSKTTPDDGDDTHVSCSVRLLVAVEHFKYEPELNF